MKTGIKKKGYMTVASIGCFFFLCVDFFVKIYTRHHIPLLEGFSYPYQGIGVFEDFCGIDFSLNYAMNKGAAWGVFSDRGEYLLVARILIMGALAVYLFAGKLLKLRKVALTVVLTGALGNVLDFFLYGHVVDMFHFVLWGYSFPVFNVADTLIFCGVITLLLEETFQKRISASKSALRG